MATNISADTITVNGIKYVPENSVQAAKLRQRQ